MNNFLPDAYRGTFAERRLPNVQGLTNEEHRLLGMFYVGIRFLDFSMTRELEAFIRGFKNERFHDNLDFRHREMVTILQCGLKYLEWKTEEAEAELKEMRIRKGKLSEYVRLEREILMISIKISLGKHEHSKSRIKDALKRATVLGTTWREIIVLIRKSLHYFTTLNIQKAVDTLEISRSKLDYDDPQLELLILNNLGVGYRLLGNYEKSIEFFQMGIEIQERVAKPSKYLRMLIYQNFAIMLLSVHRYRKAISYIEKSISDIKFSEKIYPLMLEQIAYGLVLLIQAYFLNGSLDSIPKAFEKFNELMDGVSETEHWGARLGYHLAQSLTELSLGNIFSANKALLSLLETLRTVPDKKRYHKISWFSWNLLIFTSFMLYQINKSPQYIEEAAEKITMLEQSFSALSNPIAKSNILLMRTILAYLGKSNTLELFVNELLDSQFQSAPLIKNFFANVVTAIRNSLRLPLVESLREIIYIMFYSNLAYYDIARLEVSKTKVQACALYKFGDHGPELLYYMGPDFALLDVQRTGVFLISLIGIGDRYPEGFWGPLPTSVEGHLGYVVTKLSRDAEMSDPRMGGQTYCALVFFVPDSNYLDPEEVHSLRAIGRRFYEEIEDLSMLKESHWENWVKKYLGM